MPSEPAVTSAESRSPSRAGQPRDRCPDVGLLLAKQPERRALTVTTQLDLCLLGDLSEVASMSIRQLNDLLGGSQLLGGVLAQYFQHPVPGGGPWLYHDHRSLDQPADGVKDLAGQQRFVSDHGLRGRESPTPLEDRRAD